jgi:photosystem II stability/assembly factor-like uncharacterized protein
MKGSRALRSRLVAVVVTVMIIVGAAVGAKPLAAAAAVVAEVWTAQSSGTTDTLRSVDFIDAQIGWAAGELGTILKTTNGGTTWIPQPAGTFKHLHSVHFVDAVTGWVVGDDGMIKKTSNGGATWTTQFSGTVNTLLSVHFVNSSTGWIVGNGGTILKTTNGGTTWTPQPAGSVYNLRAVHFLDINTGWVVGGPGVILKTANGGMTWTAQQSGTTQPLFDVHFANTGTGWIVGHVGTILKTTNGGTTWTPQQSGTTESLYSISFADAATGCAVGYSGTILTTTNGGTTWTLQPKWESPGSQTSILFGADLASPGMAWAVGYGGTILHRSDTTAPAIIRSTPKYASKLTKLTLSASDSGGSGLSRIEYRVNGGAVTKVYAEATVVSLTKLGRNTLSYRAVDKADNPSEWKSDNVTVKYTSLTHYAPSVSAYRSAKLYGYLKYANSSGTMTPLSDRTVSVQQYVSGSWKTIGKVKTSSTGKWSYTAAPKKKATYRAVYAGTSTYLKRRSAKRYVLPKVYFSSAPRFLAYTHTYGKAYKVWGYMKPKHTSGSKQVKVLAYRKTKQSDGTHKYVHKETFYTKISNPSGSSYSKYTGYVRLPSKGDWRLRVKHDADSKNAKTYSSYRYVTVK